MKTSFKEFAHLIILGILAILMLIAILSLPSCATMGHFPSQDIVVSAPTSCGRVFVVIKKGSLEDHCEGEWWITKKDFIEQKEKLSKPMDTEI